MQAYRYDENTFFYKEIATCQIDPLESEIAGKDIWLLPANCTWIKPLEEKEGFDIKFDKDKNEWEYVEKKKDPEPEPYVPSEREILEQKLYEKKSELAATDYRCLKYVDECYTAEEYAPYKAERQALRDEINKIQEEIDKLPPENQDNS